MISPVSAGGGFTRTGIGTIVDMSSLEIEIDVNEAYINRVGPGQAVAATLDAYPDWKIPCHVIAIIPTADRQRATVEVRVGFDELDPRILPDMGVKVAFQEAAGEAPDTPRAAGLSVPAAAVRRDQGRDYLLIVKEGRVERRAVATEPGPGGSVRVTSGLAPGESVVVEGPPDLADGMAVREK
jgi:RND family efflux transporter MFP subunit